MNQQTGKLDLTKADTAYYTAARRPEQLTLPPYNYLALTGYGSPDSKNYATSIESMYRVAYGIKGIYKQTGADFVVPKLEGLWWVDAKVESFTDAMAVPREEWHWKLLIRQPDYVTAEAAETARNQALAKFGQTSVDTSEKLHQVAFESMEEGFCVQMLHQGPFADEPITLAQIHSYIEEQGFTPTGKHHEIYLSDFRRTAPDKLRTILRQPVK